MHDLLIVAHVAAGATGLAAAPVAGFARKRRGLHTTAGWTYQLCCAVLCLSALALVALDRSLWPFALIAVPTQVAAASAVVVRRRRRPGWLPLHAQLVMSSYVSFVTAFVVQTAGGFWWVVPVGVGSAVITLVMARLTAAGRRAVLPAV